MGSCNCSKFCCALIYIHSSFAIILMGKRERERERERERAVYLVFLMVRDCCVALPRGLSAVCDCGIS